MLIYDDMGNMTSSQAGTLAREMAQQVGKLYDTLFTEGMTVVEARALLSYLTSEITMAAIMCMMQHQIGGKYSIPVNITGNRLICQTDECPYDKECANHKTADNFRVKNGATPDLVETDSGWECDKQPEQIERGAILVNGTCASNDWRYFNDHFD